MYYLSLCSVVKDEGPYIREWLLFHLKNGVEHFYIYDNGSTDDTIEVLKEFDEVVTLNYTKGMAVQRATYNKFIDTYRKENEFVGFTDVDEFLYSTKHQDLKETIANYDLTNLSGVAIHWLLFGSNGHLKYEDKPVLDRFTKRANSVNDHVKTVLKMSDAASCYNNVHCFRAYQNIVDEYFNVLPEEYSTYPGTADILRINHYVTKSKEECKIRRSKPRADDGSIRSKDFFEAHDVNEITDTDILKRK